MREEQPPKIHNMQDDRLNLILSSLFYAEKKAGGILTGGVNLEQLNTWHRLADIHDGTPSVPITEDELRELEARNLVHNDHGTWRGVLGRLGDNPVPFGLADPLPLDATEAGR